jgi:hypothetical protein
VEDPYETPAAADPANGSPPRPDRSKKTLWASLLGPAAVVVLSNLILARGIGGGEYGANYLYTLPSAGIAILAGLIAFSRATIFLPRGRFWVLQFAYLPGQIVLCLIIWAGSCSALTSLGLDKGH